MIEKLSNFLKSDTAMSIKDSIVEGFKVARFQKKIFNFMKENPKLKESVLHLVLGELMKGIMMLKGGAFGGIMRCSMKEKVMGRTLIGCSRWFHFR